MNALFAADSICKKFGEREILKSASLWASPGRITALLGRNGCGKTTLLRIGAGLLSADAGAVHFDGHCYPRPRLATLAQRGLFYLPVEDLLPWQLTVRESLRWLEATYRTGALEAAVRALGIEPFLEQHPGTLSGGERRRTDVAAVLTRAPRCLLADEPLLGMAPLDAEALMAAFRRLAADGCAVVVTGHEVPLLLELADEVIWMVAGTTHVLGNAAEARRHDAFIRDYLGWTTH